MSDPMGEQQSFEAAWEVITRRTFDRAMAASDLAHRSLKSLGTFRSEEGELWVGRTALSKDREHLPRLARATGLGFALYAGNRRIAASTVLDAGCAPDLGEFAAAPLADTVLRRGEIYRGHVDYAGRQYLVVGRPLFTKDGDRYAPIGMLEAFQDQEAFYDLLSASAQPSFEGLSSDSDKRADSVESMIQFVDTVARRLQLLALNGNIIAAQAGQQGNAFRVVCSQLGILADQAKTTTTQIRKLFPKSIADHEEDASEKDEEGDSEAKLGDLHPEDRDDRLEEYENNVSRRDQAPTARNRRSPGDKFSVA